MNNPNVIVLWQAPTGPAVKVEYRLYYDANGRVLFYTCEKPAGKFVVVDSQTYAEGRPDLRVIDGKISNVLPGQIVARLTPGGKIRCAKEDISIVVASRYRGKTQKWELQTHEL